MGNRWQENRLIFPSVIGTPMDPHNLLKNFKTLLRKAGLPMMRFHDLRHTSITLVLYEIGAPIKKSILLSKEDGSSKKVEEKV